MRLRAPKSIPKYELHKSRTVVWARPVGRDARLPPEGKAHFSIADAQLRVTERGAAVGSSTLVATRNLCPSALTS